MYEALEQAPRDSAQAVSRTPGGNELDRNNRSKIYQGLMAASRGHRAIARAEIGEVTRQAHTRAVEDKAARDTNSA